MGRAIVLLIGLLTVVAGCNRGPREVRIDLAIIAGQLNKRELYVPVNTQVALTLSNRDTQPSAGRSFVFVLVQPGATFAPQPADILARSPVIAPGRSATFRFAAPSSGNYEFFCSSGAVMPASSDSSQTVLRGKFVVQ